MRRYAWLFLGLVPLLNGCPHRKPEAKPDYDSVRESSERSHKNLDKEKGPGGE